MTSINGAFWRERCSARSKTASLMVWAVVFGAIDARRILVAKPRRSIDPRGHYLEDNSHMQPGPVTVILHCGERPLIDRNSRTPGETYQDLADGDSGGCEFTIIPHAAMSETSANCWKLSVIRVFSPSAWVVESPSSVSSMAPRKSAKAGWYRP